MTFREQLSALQHKYALLEQETARLHAALRAKKQLEYLIETAFDPMWLTDEDGRIKMVNPAFLELVGCSTVDEVYGHGIWYFTVEHEGVYESATGEQISINQAYFDGLMENAEILVEQGKYSRWNFYCHNKKSGKVVPATQNIVFLYSDQGQTTGAFGIIHDLTDIRAAEHRMERARGFLQNIIDTSGDGLLVTDTEGTIVLVNKGYAGMLGYAGEELTGRPVYEVLLAGQVDEADLELPGSMNWLLEEGTLRGYETVHHRRNGSTVEVEVNMSFLNNDDGTLRGIVSSIRDITERRLAEAALRESEEKYRSLVENLTIGVFRTRLDELGSVLHANTGLAKMVGFDSAEQMIGVPIVSFYKNPEERSAVVNEIITTGGLKGKEIFFKKINSDIRLGSISATLIYDKDDQPYCVDGIIEDITERKQAEEFLQRSHEKLEAMVQERTVELKDVNTALRILLRKREEDKAKLEETMVVNIQNLVVPNIKRLKALDISDRAGPYLDIVLKNISQIAQPLLKGKSHALLNLTDSELQIVNLIKQQKSTRQIAAMTGLSSRTIDHHRENIRKKLGLSNSKINLTTYIMSLA